MDLGTENSLSQFCGNCDRYVFQSIYKHRIGYEKENDVDFSEPEESTKYTVLVEKTGVWSPFKGLLNENTVRGDPEGNLKNRELSVGVVNVSHINWC